MKLLERKAPFLKFHGLQDYPIFLHELFICGGNLKGKVSKNNPHKTEELKMTIRNENMKITQHELAIVTLNLLKRADLCIHVNGGHIKHLL